MKIILQLCVLVLICLGVACASKATTQKNDLIINRANSQEAKTNDKTDTELQKQIEQIASAANGRVGVKAVLLETGEEVSLNAGGHFPMQSIYKVPIGMAVLQWVETGKLKLNQKVRVEKSDFVRAEQHSPIRDKNPNGTELTVGELLRFAVSQSDGTACDVLLNLLGGAETVDKYLNNLEIHEMVVANTEKEIGRDWETQYRNWATPDAAVTLLRALFERRGISEKNLILMLKLMTETPTGPKRLKGLLPKDAVVAHKTGTSGTEKGITAATNDIGLITLPNGRHLIIAVFVSDSPADETVRETVIAKISKAIWDQWGN